MIEAVLSIVTGRGRPLVAGAWLGVLAAAQLFTGEEMVSDVAIAGLVLVAVLAVSRPSAVRARLGGTAIGLGVAAVVALLLCAHALWIQFHGPLAEHGSPWLIAQHGNGLGAFVNPQAQLVFHTASSAAYAASHGANAAEYLAYLGPPLLILVAAVTIRYWRDLRVRAAAVTWAVLEVLSLGVNGPLLPFHWLQGLPLLGDMLPSRLVHHGGRRRRGGARVRARPGHVLGPAGRPGAILRRAVPVVVALLAVLPLVPRPVAAITAPRGAGRLGHRVHAPGPASRTRACSSCPSRTRSRARRCSGRPIPASQASWSRAGSSVPFASGRAVTSYWGPQFTAETVMCLDALWQGTAAGQRLRHGRTDRAQLLAPGRRCRGHQPGDTARAVPHQDSR